MGNRCSSRKSESEIAAREQADLRRHVPQRLLPLWQAALQQRKKDERADRARAEARRSRLRAGSSPTYPDPQQNPLSEQLCGPFTEQFLSSPCANSATAKLGE